MGETEAILLAALVGGALAVAVRLPPLVGFLGAGFALAPLGVSVTPAVQTVADLGVTILLFGIGLKIDLRSLLRREVLMVSTVHIATSAVMGFLLLGALALIGLDLARSAGPEGWLFVGFALSFSSTVLVVKMLEQRSATRSLSGRTAIGILVVQDVAAVAFIAAAEAKPPSPWAVSLVALVAVAPLLGLALSRLGHDELLPLFGIVLALVPGYWLFETVGIKGDLGALVMGMLLAGSPRSVELAKSLFTLKDLLLVGFFVSIGLGGVPTPSELFVAVLLLGLLPVQALVFAGLFWMARMRRRTSVLTAGVLTNFSEFALIVAVAAPDEVLGEEWVTVLGTAVAMSFVLSTVVTSAAGELLARAARRVLPDRPVADLHPDDRPLDLRGYDAVVLGMGRVGRGAYDRLREEYGLRVLGIESAVDRCHRLAGDGYDVVEGDATDPELWTGAAAHEVSMVLLAMPFHGNNMAVLERLRAHDFTGTVALVAQYDDDLRHAARQGADAGFQIYDGAGTELADRAVSRSRR